MNPSHYPTVTRSRSPTPDCGRRDRANTDSRVRPKPSEGNQPQQQGRRRGNTQLPDRLYGSVNITNQQQHSGELENMVGDLNHSPSINNDAMNIPNITIERNISCENDFLSTTDTIGMINSSNNHTSNGGLHYTPGMEDRLRRKLKFFFMDPCQKWRAKKRFPWKLGLQVLKIVLLTFQLTWFGYERSSFVEFVERNTISFKHLFLQDWDPSFETMPYPPATGVYAIYEKTQVYEHMNFALYRYDLTPEIALGGFRVFRNQSTNLPLLVEMCISHYHIGDIYDNDTYIFDSKIDIQCFSIYHVIKYNTTTHKNESVYDVETFLQEHNKSINFDRLLQVTLKFSLKSVNLETYAEHAAPECYKFNITITFDNNDHDGQMLVELTTYVSALTCQGKILYEADNVARKRRLTVFDSFVIIVSVLSCLLCLRSLARAQKLSREVMKYFWSRCGKKLSMSDRFEFWNMWYVLIICNDVITIIGSAFKIQLETKKAQSSSENYDFCSMLLGTGSFMAWFGVLRYLNFFRKFNILLLTLKKASPNVLRFSVCALMLYFGFTFCGWAVLGPYHIKFRHLSTASECLFSLVNGDDMFVTFSATQTSNMYIWYYSRIYLYVFISLFIYVVLSLFIAVIMDSYDTIKHYYKHGFPKSDLHEFMDQCTDPPHSPLYRKESKGCNLLGCLPCFKHSDPDSPTEHTHLLT